MPRRQPDPSGDPPWKDPGTLLVYMPFGALLWPSLGLSLLRASLAQTELHAEVRYFSIDFARLIGTESYLQILQQCDRYNLGAEWVFAKAVLPISHEHDELFVRHILLGGAALPAHLLRPLSRRMVATLRQARDIVEPFLDECLHEIIAHHPKVVGFSSEYQQEMASLALAQRIKERLPQTFVVFGGPNCEGVMGIEMMRRFAFVDAVVSGEGEAVFPQLVQRVIDGGSTADLRGVHTRENLDSRTNGALRNTRPLRNLDDLPYVDYDDYFQQFSACGIQPPYGPWILFETSRACWWGARKPCAFCGVNGADVSHRVKSGARSFDELRHLGAKYPGNPVLIVDKTLARERFQDLIPKLAGADFGFNIFCETRANLSKDQVRALRDAGIKTVQPGIESLSSEILELMGKGVTALQNIQFLKWCKEFGITPGWNFLFGFPSEPPAAYARMAALIPHLVHLPPPVSTSRVVITRFSPYFEQSETWGLSDLKPLPAELQLYPFAPKDVANLSGYFAFDLRSPQRAEDYAKPLLDQVVAWQNIHGSSELFSVDEEDRLLIWDERPGTSKQLTVLTGAERTIYIAGDRARTRHSFETELGQRETIADEGKDIRHILRSLVARGLMVHDHAHYLSLAIPVGDYSPPSGPWQRFCRQSGKLRPGGGLSRT